MKPCRDAPCSGCPMRRKSMPGWLGSDDPEHFIQTVHDDSHMPCHPTVNYSVDDWRDQILPGSLGSATECAGVAIYRANVNKRPRPFVAGALRFELRTLPPNKRTVFASPAEFLKHHTQLLKRKTRAR